MSSKGWSGSALFVGKPTDLIAKALVFQNFERPMKRVGTEKPLVGDNGSWVIRGILLPQEIRRQAEIVQGEPSPKSWYSRTKFERIRV